MKPLFIIQNNNPDEQLELFYSALKTGKVPAILPQSINPADYSQEVVPEAADFAVATSGSRGKPKLYYRSLKSWTDFFAQQNSAFNILSSSRIFIQGSLAFTGNLNIAAAAKENGNFLYISNTLKSSVWAEEIIKNKINTIYMIPDKLYHLSKTGRAFPEIKSVICGSQFISQLQFRSISKTFPEADVFLYYGTSEVSYISWKRVTEENCGDFHCAGEIFSSVKVTISSENHILVDSPWKVIGIDGIYDTGDLGFIKNEKLYLTGRSDDVINIHGQKINKGIIEECLLKIKGIEEAEVQCCQINFQNSVVAHIAGENLPEKIDTAIFSEIPSVFIPKKYIRYKALPKNESGKVSIRT